ncbi:Na+/H+ antiporter subunit E [Pararhizobium mangrovi]|uniref:Na+/H+ antiporter subunit E n=2 Tax=Pararhizobium mangrovi TaxID=2590452 RepID=A0A506U0G5_9HYPH|nr:Na+/H+ antiporter subunit E [Pararhizobium mangrovi]TPW26681.1 Na+/H+ antiporter subunit E [Pararhizobium mangrovi]
MNTAIMNLLLAVVWVAVTGSLTVVNFAFGFVLAMVGLWLVREQVGTVGYLSRTWRLLILALLFLYELAMSAYSVAKLVLSPRMDLKPGIFAYPLRLEGDFEITLLANLITLTPGTLSVDVSDDCKTLYVHAIDCSDPEAARRDIAEGFERRIMEAFC